MKPDCQQRRRFIRVTGGGVIAGATLSASGCARSPFAIPEAAITAWRKPKAKLPLREWVLSHALLAPNPHNRQPWLVSLEGENDIVLRIDTDRLLPHTDPVGRQILIGTGAFLGLLELAAAERGYRADIQHFPAGSYTGDGVKQFDGRPVAHIGLSKDESIKPDPLFKQLFARHTERGVYDLKRELPETTLERIRAATGNNSMTVNIAARGGAQSALTDTLDEVAKQAWAIEVKTPHTMMESVELLRVGAAEIEQHRDGISLTDPMLVLIDKLGMFDRSVPPAPDGSIVQSQIDEFNEKIDSTPGFYTLKTTDNSRTTQLQAGRAYVRAQLAATALGLVMQPVSQALQEYPEMDKQYASVHKALEADLAAGQTVQMFCRIGFLAADEDSSGPAPRRGLKAHL